MEVASEFLNNVNVMLFIVMGILAIGVGLLIVSKVVKGLRNTVGWLAIFILKEVLISFVIFNTLNFTFSAGIHWKYSS